MSDQSDSQNKSKEQVQVSEGTSPSSSSDDGSRSTPINLPKAATRTRKKKTSESEDEDYVAIEDEATSKKKVLKKEYGSAAATKPGQNRKIPAKRTPMLKVRGSTKETEKSDPKEPEVTEKKATARRIPTSKPRKVSTGETMKFTIESEGEAVGQDKRTKESEPLLPRYLASPL